MLQICVTFLCLSFVIQATATTAHDTNVKEQFWSFLPRQRVNQRWNSFFLFASRRRRPGKQLLIVVLVEIDSSSIVYSFLLFFWSTLCRAKYRFTAKQSAVMFVCESHVMTVPRVFL